MDKKLPPIPAKEMGAACTTLTIYEEQVYHAGSQ